MAGALLAAAGELPAWLAWGVLFAGIAVSDWALYGFGWLTGTSLRLQSWIGPARLAQGRGMLRRNIYGAMLTARLVPWLLFPIFVSCGFLRIGFGRFLLVNLVIAGVYSALLFWALLVLDRLLLERLEQWGWLVAVGMILAIFLVKRHFARRAERRRFERPEGQ